MEEKIHYDPMAKLKFYRELFALCKEFGVKSIKEYGIEAEFHVEQKEQMSLDPKTLAKVLSDSMPPDSSMLFASTEEITDAPAPGPAPTVPYVDGM